MTKSLPVLQPNGCARVCCSGFEIDFSRKQLWEEAFKEDYGRSCLEDAKLLFVLLEFQYETETGYHYTCRAYDEETGDCTIYEDRPQMCKDFPGNGGCEFPGCGFKGEGK